MATPDDDGVIRAVMPPTLSRFIQSTASVRGIMGPFGSGKSTACCWDIFKQAHEQRPGRNGIRRSRYGVVRNTYPELRDTTMQTWLDWFPDTGPGRMLKDERIYRWESGDVFFEVWFRALDRPGDIGRLLSLELTSAWVNEAREIPYAIIRALRGRLGRWPPARDEGCSRVGLAMDTNPPDDDHWWHVKFEEEMPEGWEIFRQPSGLSPEAENIENLRPGYYTDMLSETEGYIRVYAKGQYGMVQDGKPMHPNFREAFHVAEIDLEPVPNSPIIVGIDFGLTPAAVFCQRLALGRWVVLDELVTDDMGAENFGKLLGPMIRDAKYANHEFHIWGDPAGEQRAQTDEKTPFQILNALGIPARPAPTNDFTLRVESVNGAIGRLVDGKAGLLLSRKVKKLKKALGGGYRRLRVKVTSTERYHDMPDKNQHSHVAEALQYAMVGEGEGRLLIQQPGRQRRQRLATGTDYRVLS